MSLVVVFITQRVGTMQVSHKLVCLCSECAVIAIKSGLQGIQQVGMDMLFC